MSGKFSGGRAVFLVGLVGVLMLPSMSSAWGRNGHRIVCDIAYLRLTPEAHELVAELQRGEAKKFPETCLWADDVKYTSRKETYRYHFINTPAGKGSVDLARDCPANDCVPWAIEHFAKILGDPSAGALKRNEALKFLGHFVGDLHQPLHCGRPGDLGGNRIKTCFLGDCGHPQKPLNLHQVWDSKILNEAKEPWRDFSKRAHQSINEEEAEAWSDSSILDWTNESYRIAEEFVYPELPTDGVGDQYYQEAKIYVAVRLKQGGVRLAHLINQAAAGAAGTKD
jgi:hypothetical protein